MDDSPLILYLDVQEVRTASNEKAKNNLFILNLISVDTCKGTINNLESETFYH